MPLGCPTAAIGPYANPKPDAPCLSAVMSFSTSCSLLSYSGRSIWLKQVWALGKRSVAPYACGYKRSEWAAGDAVSDGLRPSQIEQWSQHIFKTWHNCVDYNMEIYRPPSRSRHYPRPRPRRHCSPSSTRSKPSPPARPPAPCGSGISAGLQCPGARGTLRGAPCWCQLRTTGGQRGVATQLDGWIGG